MTTPRGCKADHRVNLRGQGDEACLAQILRDEIDILIIWPAIPQVTV